MRKKEINDKMRVGRKEGSIREKVEKRIDRGQEEKEGSIRKVLGHKVE